MKAKDQKQQKFDPDCIYENESIDSFEMEELNKAVIFDDVKIIKKDLIDKMKKPRQKVPDLLKIKIITDLLNRDDIEEDKSKKLEKNLLMLVNKMINNTPDVKKRLGFKYYENVKKYSTAEDIIDNLIN